MNRVVLFDLSWHMYRSYYTFGFMSSSLDSGVVKPTGHIFGVLSSIQEWLTKYPDDKVILCEDGRPKGKDIIPSYKEGRAVLDYPIMLDRDLVEQIALLSPNVFVAYNETEEADHVMCTLADKYKSLRDVVIFSGDNDLLQSLDDTVSIYRGHSKDGDKWITYDSYFQDPNLVKKFHGVEPFKLPVYRAIVGDSSDNLRGYDRFPRDLASCIASNWDYALSIEKNIDSINQTLVDVKKSWSKYLFMMCDDIDVFYNNFKVMRLYQVPLSRRYLVSSTDSLSKAAELRLSKWLTFVR